jgi:hypothetical protein
MQIKLVNDSLDFSKLQNQMKSLPLVIVASPLERLWSQAAILIQAAVLNVGTYPENGME